MPRRKTPTLTEAELRLMNVIWQKGQGTVGEIADALDADPPLAYNTVLTTLRILESKGVLRHRKEGRAFVYEPVFTKDEVRGGALRHLLSRLFDNSPELLVANLLNTQAIDKSELARVRNVINEYNRKEKA